MGFSNELITEYPFCFSLYRGGSVIVMLWCGFGGVVSIFTSIWDISHLHPGWDQKGGSERGVRM